MSKNKTQSPEKTLELFKRLSVETQNVVEEMIDIVSLEGGADYILILAANGIKQSAVISNGRNGLAMLTAAKDFMEGELRESKTKH